MKVLFTYKSAEAVKKETAQGIKLQMAIIDGLDKVVEIVDTIADKINDAGVALTMMPSKLHVKVIHFRLNMTDKYLKAKVEGCRKLLRALALERKKIVREQEDAQTTLNEIRANFIYPENPLN